MKSYSTKLRLVGDHVQRRCSSVTLTSSVRQDAQRHDKGPQSLPYKRNNAETRTPPAAHRAVSQCSVVLFCFTVTTQEHKSESGAWRQTGLHGV